MNIEAYNRMQGLYKFDANDELVYEERNRKYRKKENKVWSGWIQKGY